MPNYFDPRDYSSSHQSGESLAGIRRDRTIDALRWPILWLAIGATILTAAYSAGYLYDKIKGGSATVRHGATETSVSVNAFSITPVSTTDDPISGR